jgi:NAD+ diphosphatase
MPEPFFADNSLSWFIFFNDQLLFVGEHPALPNTADSKTLQPYFTRAFLIGSLEGEKYACAELPTHIAIPPIFKTVPLKQALSSIHTLQYGLAVKSYSILQWDKNHQFCSRCATATALKAKDGFERYCPACHLSFFPRISPSIIVLIKKNDQLLMARSPHFLPGVFGLIAGFVEAGETLEEAVYREVREEVGIEIKNLQYFGSQAWPFPDSLMVGFMAEYSKGKLRIDPQEIEKAGWFRYDKLPGRPSVSISIATQLLDAFIQSNARTD